MVGRDQSGDDRGGARSHAAGEGDLAADPEKCRPRAAQGFEGADHKVAAIERHVERVAADREGPRLLHLEFEVKIQNHRHHVVARSEIGRRSGNPDESMPFSHPAKYLAND